MAEHKKFSSNGYFYIPTSDSESFSVGKADNINQSNLESKEYKFEHSGAQTRYQDKRRSSVNPYIMDSVSKAESVSKAKSRTYSCIKCLPRTHLCKSHTRFTIQRAHVTIFNPLYVKLRTDVMLNIGTVNDEYLSFIYRNAIHITNVDTANDSLVRSITEKVTEHLCHSYEISKLCLENTFNYIIKSLSMKFEDVSQRVAKTNTLVLLKPNDVLCYLFYGYIFYETNNVKDNSHWERQELHFSVETSRVCVHSSVHQTKTAVFEEFNLKYMIQTCQRVFNRIKSKRLLILPSNEYADQPISSKYGTLRLSQYLVKQNFQPDQYACHDIIHEVIECYAHNFICNEILNQQMERNEELVVEDKSEGKQDDDDDGDDDDDNDDDDNHDNTSQFSNTNDSNETSQSTIASASNLNVMPEISVKEVIPPKLSVFDYSKLRNNQYNNIMSQKDMMLKQHKRLCHLDSVRALHEKISRLRQKSATTKGSNYIPRAQRKQAKAVSNDQNNQSNLLHARKAFIACGQSPYKKFENKFSREKNTTRRGIAEKTKERNTTIVTHNQSNVKAAHENRETTRQADRRNKRNIKKK